MTDSRSGERRQRRDRERVLAGHKRHKKRLIPPLLSAIPHKPVSTLDQIFPEVFWMSLIFQNVGPHAASRAIIPALKSLYQLDHNRLWYRTSTLLMHFEEANERLTSSGTTEGLAAAHDAITMIAGTYGFGPEGSKRVCADPEIARGRIVESIYRYWDKSQPEYCSVLATCVVALAVAGRLKVPRSLLAGVNSILEEPGSLEAEATSSMLRALSNAFFPQEEDNLSRSWSEAFWKRNFHLDECRFSI
jgi:hypothetical protein